MKSCRLSFAFLVALVFSSVAQAQSSRVFVSARSGNDANLCNNINTPCQTFAGAIAQVAAGGEVIVLDTGGYGPATITKALSIEANGNTAFIHPSAGDALTINAGASDVVVIRGLTLNGGPDNGIRFNTGGALHVENCVISGFAGVGLAFLSSGQLFVKGTIVRRNSGQSGVLIYSGKASIENCRVENNFNGFTAGEGARVTIRNSVVSGNANLGLDVEQLPSTPAVELNVEGCLIANNGIGILSYNALATARVSNSTVTDNGRGLLTQFGGALLSRVNNTVQGNTTDGTFTAPYTAK